MEYKEYKPENRTEPDWKKVLINPVLSENFEGFKKLARNFWWTWTREAVELFEMIDPVLWEKVHHNPIALAEVLSLERMKELEKDRDFVSKFEKVYARFLDYMKEGENKAAEQIAYFSMEFGIHDTLKTYSGGLGILAGDYLKEASDQNRNMFGVSLLYRYGYFQQKLGPTGDQVADYLPQKFSHLPLHPVRDENGNWVKIHIKFPGRKVYAKIWKAEVGRVPLYLLDTDIEDNHEEDRRVTHQLYGGDLENRLKQEMMLGIGGIRLIEALGLKPDIYHSNEGHSAFISFERLNKLIHNADKSFDEAVELVRNSTLFTTHTPVPAGHDVFPEDLMKSYMSHYPERLGIDWEKFMDLGKMKKHENIFSMSVLAMNMARKVNGVSEIHGRVSREMFAPMYPGYLPDEIHIGHVTNGVHYPTWASHHWQELIQSEISADFIKLFTSRDELDKILKIENRKIWEIRKQLKKELFDFLKSKIEEDYTKRQESPKVIVNTLENLDEEALTIGFARRFATYKRAQLLFNNTDRLAELVNQQDRPVIFLYAGKAHPRDTEGQALIKKIIETSRDPRFIGKIIFLENYDITIARKMVQGVDVWLNTPTRPLEASGTSGQKAAMNGVLNFSVLDGWWAEGYRENAGWAIKEKRTFDNQKFQNELDAETLYNILEDEIIPLYFQRDKEDVPDGWVYFIKKNLTEIAPRFTMSRMVNDYYEKYYNQINARLQEVLSNNFVSELVEWKRKVSQEWEKIRAVHVKVPDSTKQALRLGEAFIAEVTLEKAGLSSEDIGIEVLFGQKENDKVDKIVYREELKNIREDGNLVTYRCKFPSRRAGVWDYAFRIYPKSSKLSHRQELPLVKWI